jgi:ketosteroid isomerase-like protein
MCKVSLFPVSTLLALMAMGCQPVAQEAAPARTDAQVQADVESLRTTWQDLANAGDAAGVAALYTDDALYVDPYGGVHQGTAAIVEYLSGAFTRSSGWELRTEGSVIHGEMVAGHGSWSATPNAPEGAPAMGGHWQNVSVYQPDGSLKIRLSLAMIPATPPAS